MTKQFVSPPNWPSPPSGWRPPTGWRPDPKWGPAPDGWQFWQEEPGRRNWFARHKVATAVLAAPLALVVAIFGLGVVVTAGSDSSTTLANPAPAATTASSPAPTSSAVTPSSASKAIDEARAKQQARQRADIAAKAAQVQAEAAQAARAAEAKAANAEAAKAAEAKAKKAKAAKAAKAKAAKAKAAKAKAAKAKAARAKAAKAKAAKERAAEDCTAGYSPCLPAASDYDCSGGSGDGPEYVDGPVRVGGSDPYDLDRDGDGFGCVS